MTRAEAITFLLNTNGRIFGVEFVKRSTGELRRMNARLGVTKHLKGGTRAYDPAAHALLCVFDLQKGAYRSVALDALTRVCIDGEWRAVEG